MRAGTDLRERLSRHRGDTPHVSAAPTLPSSALGELPPDIAARLSPPLAERLARLRPRTFDPKRREPAGASDIATAQALAGRVLAPGLLRVDRHYRLPHRHGRHVLRPLPASSGYGLVDPTLDAIAAPQEMLLFDIETNGLSGGAGTLAFVVGCARFGVDRLTISQFVLLEYGAEAALLDALADIATGVKALVTYNGRSFDAPLVQSRYRMHRRANALAPLAHLDLLYWVRRHRPASWPDSRLGTIEAHWLALERSDDTAGADVPRAWQDWLAARDPTTLDGVLRHNRLDLVTLACVLDALAMPRRMSQPGLGPAQAGIFAL